MAFFGVSSMPDSFKIDRNTIPFSAPSGSPFDEHLKTLMNPLSQIPDKTRAVQNIIAETQGRPNWVEHFNIHALAQTRALHVVAPKELYLEPYGTDLGELDKAFDTLIGLFPNDADKKIFANAVMLALQEHLSPDSFLFAAGA